jgi:2-dehydropantoate 2-reductase
MQPGVGMKIAVVGCGAVGSYYGAKLAHAGQQLHFLLRSDYDVVRRNGVTIHSPQGDFQVRPKCARSPNEIGVADLVLIGLKTTANDQFERLLPPLVGPETAVLTLQNGLGNEERLARLVKVEQILGGLCFVCLNRVEPGVIHHFDHGQVILGEFQRWPEPRTHDIASMFKHAGVACSVTDNLARTHWEKLVWNIPFNGLGVAAMAGLEPFNSRGTNSRSEVSRVAPTFATDKLLGDPRWAALVRELMLEVIGAGRAQGLEVKESLADKQLERTRSMGPYKASTLIDFERGLPLELESLFLEPLVQAKKVGAVVPVLERLCYVLGELDRARAGVEKDKG